MAPRNERTECTDKEETLGEDKVPDWTTGLAAASTT